MLDEIIGCIMEFIPKLHYQLENRKNEIGQESVSMDTAIALSRVSHRFRKIALDTPRLWSEVCVNTRYPRLDLFLKLGGKWPLYIRGR